MATPTMNTAHSQVIAWRRPRKSAVLCEVTVSSHVECGWSVVSDVRSTEESTSESADTEERDDEALANDGEAAGGRVAWGCAFREAEEEVGHEEDI